MNVQPSTIGGPEGLRERNFAQTIREEGLSSGRTGLDTPQDGDDVEKERKTFGRTPSGTSMFVRWWGYYFDIGCKIYIFDADLDQSSQYRRPTTWSHSCLTLDNPKTSRTLL
jgi:hypothetical protein